MNVAFLIFPLFEPVLRNVFCNERRTTNGIDYYATHSDEQEPFQTFV